MAKRSPKQRAVFVRAPPDLVAAFDERCGKVPRMEAVRDLMQQVVDGKAHFTWEGK